MRALLRNYWRVFLLIGLSLITIWPLFAPGYFSHHDDLQVIRIFEMRKCFVDFQIPCRWVPDMGYGNGYPLFNYYNPFIYYLGVLFSYFVGFVVASKLLFLIALTLGPFVMYFLAKEFWGKLGGLTSAILFMFVPYRALDAYVRGAVSELFAMSLVPLIALLIFRLVKRRSANNFLLLTVTSAVFLLTHNVSVVIWFPFLAVWAMFWLYQEGGKNITALLLSAILAAGLAGFFIMPALFEKDLVTSDSLVFGDLNFHVHFTSITQLFTSRFWGYGASVLGPKDQLSMQIGWPHWWLVIASVFSVIFLTARKRQIKKISLVILLAIFFIFAAFLTHNKSTVIWESIPFLSFLQFPWRYLGVVAFAAALVGGFVVSQITQKFRSILFLTVVVLVLAFNWSYFRPEKYYPSVNDETKLSAHLLEEQTKGALLDYLPVTAKVPTQEATATPIVLKGSAEITNFVKKSNYWEFIVQNANEVDIEVPIFVFPGWEVPGYSWYTGDTGKITVQGVQGTNVKVVGYFKNTPIRNIANAVTVMSFLLLLLGVRYGKTRKFFE